jgi:hypothetical protein
LLGIALRQPDSELATLTDGLAAPYHEWLSRVLIRRRESGRVVMRIDQQTAALTLEGEQQFLGALAENIEGLFDSELGPGAHLHVEYYEDHHYLDPSEISLVVIVDEDQVT